MTTTENGQRDELALDIFLADNGNIPEGELREDWVDAPDQHRPYAQNIADGLIAKGYRRPRTVTTMEELDALPEGSVVLDRNGLSLHKMGPLGMWNASNHTWDVQRDELEADAFPATVLHEPEAGVGT